MGGRVKKLGLLRINTQWYFYASITLQAPSLCGGNTVSAKEMDGAGKALWWNSRWKVMKDWKTFLYRYRLRLVSPSIRQPSYKMADRIEGLRAKHAKKVSGCSWNSMNTGHANLPTNDSDWPGSKYSVKLGRHTVPRNVPHRAVPCCVKPRRTEA